MSINGENNELEDMGNIQKETKEKLVNEKDDDDDEGGTDIVVKGVTLSKSRIDITFPEIDDNEDVTVKTYKSIPYREDKLDIDLPNFSLTKLKKTHWKASQGCSYLLFTLLYGISVAFIYSEKTKAYRVDSAKACFVIAGIQILRIFWIPLFYYSKHLEYLDAVKTASETGTDLAYSGIVGLSGGQFTACIVLFIISACALVGAGVVCTIKAKRLNAHIKELEKVGDK